MGMTLSKANKKMAFKKAKDEAVKRLIDEVNTGLALQMELVMLLVLHDKFGFGGKRCLKALTEFEETWDSMNKSELTGLTIDDIAQVVKEEIGIKIDEETLDIVSGRKQLNIAEK